MPPKKFYITTSIIYVNAFPHIGFALELVQADALARYHRILGDDVFFLTGTDEHGTKIVQAAKKSGEKPKNFVDKISNKVKKLTKVLNVSNDDFIRTTDKKRHWPAVEKVWLKLKKNGDIYKKKYKGLYCVGCEAFVQKKDLAGGKCPFHQKEPEIVEEENYFFRLSKYAAKIEKILKKDEIKIIPEARKNEILSFIRQGIEDISCSRLKRKVEWGVPVPGDNSQTIYVWFEALINYISALGYGENGNNFKKYWPADVHCLGKDIFRFHSLLWPAMLLSLGLKLPKKIFVHGFTTVNGQKMSKSLGNIVDPFKLVEKYSSARSPQVGTDAVRYFLLGEISPTEDGDFTYQKFEERYNSDLASGIGNLLSRVRVMADNRLIPLKAGLKAGQNPEVQKKIQETEKKYKNALESFKFNEALKAIWELIGFSDRYIEKERPWEDKNQKSKIKNQKVINNLLAILDNIAKFLEPFLPETSGRIKKEIERDKKSGTFINKRGKVLFPRLD
jgi:methionyl-tRNA synthetase